MSGDVNVCFSPSICEVKRLCIHVGNEGGDLGGDGQPTHILEQSLLISRSDVNDEIRLSRQALRNSASSLNARPSNIRNSSPTCSNVIG